MVVDAASLKATDTIRVGRYPHGLVVAPDGGRVYVTDNRANGDLAVIG